MKRCFDAQEGQPVIAVHASKTSRRPALPCCGTHCVRQIKRVSDGLDPMNVIRDERLNRTIPTNAWNTILSPSEASALQGEEV